MEKLLLKPTEVAEVLRIGRSLVYTMLATGELPSVRVGRCIRIPTESLERWLKTQEKGGSSEVPSAVVGKEAGGGLPPPPQEG